MSLSDRNELAHGVYAALATPRRTGLAEPDTAALLDYVDVVARAGVDGLVLFAANGEFVHFDNADRTHALKMAIRRSRVPVLVNVSHSTLDGALALADGAIDSGAAGLLLLPPYFYRYHQDDIHEFYMRFRSEVAEDVPVYLDNLPLCTNEISRPLAARLLGTGRFAGMNDASGDWDFFDSLLQVERQAGVRLLIGNERLYLRGRKRGTAGCISGIAAVLPELAVAMERALRGQSDERAHQLDGYLQEYRDRIERLPPTLGVKNTAVARGWKFNHSGAPLSAATQTELDEFRRWVHDWLPVVLKECERA
jgi:4-hydroxy-tetrahydrodipicolinate synthase